MVPNAGNQIAKLNLMFILISPFGFKSVKAEYRDHRFDLHVQIILVARIIATKLQIRLPSV